MKYTLSKMKKISNQEDFILIQKQLHYKYLYLYLRIQTYCIFTPTNLIFITEITLLKDRLFQNPNFTITEKNENYKDGARHFFKISLI